jgi:hypothetical protein
MGITENHDTAPKLVHMFGFCKGLADNKLHSTIFVSMDSIMSSYGHQSDCHSTIVDSDDR